MQTAILTLHVIVCLVLVILVLLQAGREGMGVIFGGSGNSSVFGSSGAGGVLVKLTAFMAVLFIATSLTYNILTSSKRDADSTFLDVQFEESAPAEPETTPVSPAEPAPAASTEPAPQTEEAAHAEPEAGEESAPAEPGAAQEEATETPAGAQQERQ